MEIFIPQYETSLTEPIHVNGIANYTFNQLNKAIYYTQAAHSSTNLTYLLDYRLYPTIYR